MALPPGPSSMLLSTLRYFSDPYGSTLRLERRYGPTYTLPTAFGPMVLTSEPEGVREILGADPETYGALGVELLGPIIGEASLILLGGARHRAARKLLAPPFHGARMRTYGATMRAIALDEAARLPRERPFVMQEHTQATSLRVIVETIFGVTAPDRAARYRAALVELIAALKPSFMFLTALRRDAWPPWRRFQALADGVEKLLLEEIHERRARAHEGEDVLTLLLAARYEDGSVPADTEIIEQLTTILTAGHETTAIALAWALHLVATHPAVEARLCDELRVLGPEPDPDAIARLPYLEAVCEETLRLYPIAPSIARLLARPMTLRGQELPAGVSVGASVIGVHRRPELYPDPEAFRPERFLERSFAPHEYLPFGGGARRCLGAAFALYEMKLVLATLVGTYVLRSVERGEVPVRVRSTVVGPRGGIRMVVAGARA